MSLSLKYPPRYTYDDYKSWEGDWELIDGIPYTMSPAPNIRHQRIGRNILFAFNQELKKCDNCEVLYEIDWRLDEQTVVRPNLVVVCEKVEGANISNPPEIVLEILSASTAHKARNLKYELYESQGVKYYLIIDPVNERVEIYQIKNKTYKKQDELKEASFHFDLDKCEIEVNFEDIWY